MAFTNQFDTTGGGVPGMGDAFITSPISNIDPIATIIQQGEQRRAQRERERQEQLKQQEDIFKGINLGSDKYWVDKDAEYFHGPEGAVTKLVDDVKKAYIKNKGKLPPIEMANIQQKLSKLQADAAQSLKDRDVYTKSIETFRNPKLGYDIDQSIKKADEGFAGAGFGKRDVNSLSGIEAKQDFGVKNQKFIKMFKDEVAKTGLRMYQPNVDLEEVKKSVTQQRGQAIEALAKAYQVDNPEATPEEAMAAVQKYIPDPFLQKKDNSITPYQKKALAQKDRALDITETKNKNAYEIARLRLKVYQDNSELQKIKVNATGDSTDPTGVTTWAYDLNKGNEKAIQRLNTFQIPSVEKSSLTDKPLIATSNKDAKIISGADIPEEDINNMGLKVDPAKKYVTMSFSENVAVHKDKEGNDVKTNKVYIEMDDKNPNVESIVNSPIGKLYNQQVIKKENTPYTNPEYAAEKHRSSNSTTTTVEYVDKNGKKVKDIEKLTPAQIKTLVDKGFIKSK